MNDASLAIRFVLGQLGKPYVWGADGPDSYDCSGLMVKGFSTIGITLPRTTQAMLADPSLQPINQGQLQPGDLVFPSDEHVQMYLGGGKVVEAPHTGLNVRITNLGTVYQARRVTTPASGDWGTVSPVSGTTPVADTQTGTTLNASDVSQMIGKGLTNSFVDTVQPLLTMALWVLEVALGASMLLFGSAIIAKRAGILPTNMGG